MEIACGGKNEREGPAGMAGKGGRMFRSVSCVVALVALAGCATATDPAVKPGDPAYVALQRHDWQAASVALKTVMAAHPHDPYVQLDLGLAYQMSGRMDLAEPLYRAAMIDGRGVMPAATATDRTAGMSLDQIACENLKAGLQNANAC